MSSREALKRMTSSAAVPKTVPTGDCIGGDPATARLAALMEEVVGLPEGEKADVLSAPLSPLKDSSRALRWFFLSDVLALIVGFASAWGVAALANRLLLQREINQEGFDRLIQYGSMSVGLLLWFVQKEQYRVRQTFWVQTRQIVTGFAFALFLDGFLQFATKADSSRLWLVSGWAFAALALIAGRVVLRSLLQARGKWAVRTLLVGGGPTADEARAALRTEKGLGYDIVAQIENLPILIEKAGNSWRRLCNKFGADYVLIALDGEDLVDADEALAQLSREDIPYAVSPPLRRLSVLGMEPQYFFSHDVVLMSPVNNLDRPVAKVLKRSLDLFVAGTALLVASPLFAFLYLLVRRDGGPAFFGHNRIGQGGRVFACLKFRSMVMDSEARLRAYLAANPSAREEWAREQKLKNDPRVTCLGAFMRKTSLDELPQLINVLKGDMSLVGPRPIVQAEVERYERDIQNYYRVRPGITGLWQVSGRSEVSYERRVQMDAWYVRNWSLWHDVAILCKTVPALLNKTGAY